MFEALEISHKEKVKIIIPDKFLITIKKELETIGFDKSLLYVFYEEGYEKGISYIYKLEEFAYLPRLEMYITNNCNFRCKNCSAFSPLVKDEIIYDINIFKRDVKRCKEIFPYIEKYRIIGGEPLLLGDGLIQYIKLVRDIYPKTKIEIATNGSLVKKISENLIKIINDMDILLYISVYPVLYSVIDSIVEYMKEKKIKFCLSRPVGFFGVLTKEKGKFPFNSVLGCACTVIENGYIGKCPILFHIKYYNQYFNTDIPENSGKINLFDNVSGKEIWKKLMIPFELCNYCNMYKLWHHEDNIEKCEQLIDREIKKEDWY